MRRKRERDRGKGREIDTGTRDWLRGVRTRCGGRRTEGSGETHCLNGSMTIATQRRYGTYTVAALHIVTSVNCRHPVVVVSWSRRGSRCWMTVAGGDNISATSIRRSPRSASLRTTSRERERERERECTPSLERRRERDGENHSAYARRVLPAHALLPPGTWYRNHEASRSEEEKEHCPSRCAASLSRPVENRGYVTTSVFEIASS